MMYFTSIDKLKTNNRSKTMPEGPEVEQVRLDLVPLLNKKVLKCTFTQLALKYPRYQVQQHKIMLVEGKRVISIERKGKFLLWYLKDENNKELWILNHLGMSGRWFIFSSNNKLKIKFPTLMSPHGKVIIIFTDNNIAIFDDIRNFGRFFLAEDLLEVYKAYPAVQKLGIDGLTAIDSKILYEKLTLKKNNHKPLGELLLDQSIVAGVGNIYKSESLFHAGLSPFITPEELSTHEVEVLAKSVHMILQRALKDGGSTIQSFQSNSGEGKAQQWHMVYGQEGKSCKICGKPIMRNVQKMRSTFYCPICQPPKMTTIIPTYEENSLLEKTLIKKRTKTSRNS